MKGERRLLPLEMAIDQKVGRPGPGVLENLPDAGRDEEGAVLFEVHGDNSSIAS